MISTTYKPVSLLSKVGPGRALHLFVSRTIAEAIESQVLSAALKVPARFVTDYKIYWPNTGVNGECLFCVHVELMGLTWLVVQVTVAM